MKGSELRMRDMRSVRKSLFGSPLWKGVLLPLLGLILLGGCGAGKPTRFYMMQPVPPGGTKAAQPSPTPVPDISVGVGPVRFPEYLDRPQIVSRSGGGEIQLDEFHRWAEPLKESFSRSLAASLANLLGTDQVAVFPWAGASAVRYQVMVDVARFDGKAGETVTLDAKWTILGEGGKKVLLVRRSTVTAPATKQQDYEGLVAAHSEALSSLSREIAAALETLAAEKGGS